MNIPNMKEAAKRFEKAKYIYENRTNQKFYEGKTYYIRTYGCQMNVHDSEEIKGLLESIGFYESNSLEKSDFIILNTCAIRENAHDKVFGFLGRLKYLKDKNPELLIGLCGCMAQLESVITDIKSKYPYIDLVFGTHNINELPTMLKKYQGKQNIKVYSKEGDVIEFDNLYKRDSNVTAFVNIMYGCDKFCTYCIVPYTRGKERSRLSKDVIKEIKELKEKGYKEVTLLGQNVNAYGKDLKDGTTFSSLLKNVSDTGIERIRFVTSHPWDFTDEMINVISRYENIMPYIHLPVQSGSNNILRLMNRRYTKEEYINLFNKIKNKVKNVSITTDIIVGFPGETEEDFRQTLDLVSECKFDGAFTFIFSPRDGTPASKMEDETPEIEKKKRLERLNEIINNYSRESNLKLLNTTQKVLITGFSEKSENKVTGYTETMKLVNVMGASKYIGKIVDVEITSAKSFSLDGIIKDTIK